MSNSQLRDTSEAEFADWRSQQGAYIVQHCGRYWQEVRPGFYPQIPSAHILSLDWA